MMLDSNNIIAMTEANQNFSRVVRMVDENGMAVIMKNNKPRYVVVDFSEYDAVSSAIQLRKNTIDKITGELIEQNMEALLELAK